MRSRTTIVALLTLAVAFGATALVAAEPVELEGEYVWSHRDDSGNLRAVFTPTGDATWDVAFHFTFRGKPHTYAGTTKGSLTAGPLEGTVKNENKKRTFTFSGTSEGGSFSGKHAELEDGTPYPTGTLTLSN